MSTTSSHRAVRGISLALMIVGALMVIVGVTTYAMVSSTLAKENITVSEDACLGGRSVAGPFTAYCEAMIISEHALAATDGKTYAELDREDPLRTVAMNGSFLRASLFTSVVAFGVAFLVAALGVLFILVGLAFHSLVGKRAQAPPMTT
jgi:hypothetical protein